MIFLIQDGPLRKAMQGEKEDKKYGGVFGKFERKLDDFKEEFYEIMEQLKTEFKEQQEKLEENFKQILEELKKQTEILEKIERK